MKRILSGLLCVLLLIGLAGCGGAQTGAETPPAEGTSTGNTAAPEGDTAAKAETFGPELPEAALAACPGLESYIKSASTLWELANYCEEQGLFLQADSYYAMSQADFGALRYACACILYLGGEGESPAEWMSGALCGDWDSLASLAPSSPYPYYFEGLLYDLQGDAESAGNCYTLAGLFLRCPEDGIDLYALGGLDAETLHAMTDALAETDKALSLKYSPRFYSLVRHPMNGSVDYLLEVMTEYIEHDSPDEALEYALAAVAADPFSGDAFAAVTLMYMQQGDYERASRYLSEGLLVDHEHEGLQLLNKVMGGEAT